MQVVKNAVAGTLESSDIYIEVSPGQGITIELTSAVMQQFGDSIKKTMMEVIQRLEVQHAHIRAHDRGALDCVIMARLETALLRAGKRDAS
ncbi:MAG: citrate lyase acyl carrier protein [Treponema sp.]|jgi:citrate lyase subunit gamma (acyl carrier protein)|nr:citrate lyase acyl carrier protein [Treponema sp.]